MHILAQLGIVSLLLSGAPTTASKTGCPMTPEPSFNNKSPLLPNPFKFLSGEPVTDKADWSCRREEIKQLFQQYELGTKPDAPDHLQSSFERYAGGDGGNLTLTASSAGKSVSWTVTVNTTYTTGPGPHPALIVLDFLTIPPPQGVVLMTFGASEFAQQDNITSRGKGLFYDLYPDMTPQSAGALMAWAWGVSRIMDALETTNIGVDKTHVGVVGCSRWGKGALVVSAFEERIALAVVQESGSGGSACWRLSDVENVSVNGTDITQTAHEIVTENVWFSNAFEVFANETDGTQRLPFDHHMLAGLVAPRGLLVIDNLGYLWLSPWSSYGCMTATREVYRALDALPAMGYSEAVNHTHCQFPVQDQGGELATYVNKYLLGQQIESDIFRTAANWTFDRSQWIDWATPDLS